jgi:hypothetical protein
VSSTEPFSPSLRHSCMMLSTRPIGRWPLALLAICAMVLICSTAGATVASTRTHTASTPRGWKTYTYGKTAISVPKTWVVRHAGYGCDDNSVPVSGTLFLLSQSSGDVCVRSNSNINSVTISPLLPGGIYRQTACPPIKLNRLTIYIGPCSSSNAAGITVWSVPALGVQALGTGTASENVTGNGNGTVVGRVLHTLRTRQ